jgi:hypothetical protein
MSISMTITIMNVGDWEGNPDCTGNVEELAIVKEAGSLRWLDPGFKVRPPNSFVRGFDDPRTSLSFLTILKMMRKSLKPKE